MKATLLIGFTLCLISSTIAQDVRPPVKQKDTLMALCQQWVLTNMSASGKTVKVPTSEAMFITYQPDGRYTDSSAMFGVSQGTWTYNSKTQTLHFDGKSDKMTMKIVSLTPTELAMEMEYPTITMTAIYNPTRILKSSQ